MTTRFIAWLDQCAAPIVIAWLDESAGPIALQVAVAVTLMLLTALLVSWILRRSAASVRHRVWALAILGLLAYPLAEPFLPKVSLGLQTASTENTADAGPAMMARPESRQPAHTVSPFRDRRLVKGTATRPDRSATPLPLPKPAAGEKDGIRRPAEATSTRATASHWPSIIAAVWAIGVLIGLGFLVKSHLAAAQLVRTAMPPSDPTWKETAGVLAAQVGLRRRVAVRISDRIAVPMTAGLFRPAILLPAGCDAWTDSRRRMVLIHELSHVARGDVLWQIAANLARAIYWPHPLVWVAVRQMQVEREAACDDAVLRDVERPSEYASLLLDVAESLGKGDRHLNGPEGRSAEKVPDTFSETAAIAMAGSRSVEERIRWIVQPGRRRLPIGRRTAWMFSVGAILIVLGLGSISLFAGPPVSTPSVPATVKEAEGTGTSAIAETAKPVLRRGPRRPAPPELVEKLLKANWCWLRPDPEYLSYTFSMEQPGKDDRAHIKVKYAAPATATVLRGDIPPFTGLVDDYFRPDDADPPRRSQLLQGVTLFGPLQELAMFPANHDVSVVAEDRIAGTDCVILHLTVRGRATPDMVRQWNDWLRRRATLNGQIDQRLYEKLKTEAGEPKPSLPMCVGCGLFGRFCGSYRSRGPDVDQLWIEKDTGRVLREEGFYQGEPQFVVTYGDFEKTSDNGQVPRHLVVRLLPFSVERNASVLSTYPWVFDMTFQLLKEDTWLLKELKESQGRNSDVAIAAVTDVRLSPSEEPSATQAHPPTQETLKLPVRVTDADGKPVADARVIPWALGGAHGHGLWQNDDKRAGVGPKEVVTGKDGTATVLYPRYNNVQERVRTSIVSLFVDHPKFVFVDGLHIDVPLESKGPYEIKMTPGVPVDVRPLIDGKPAPLDDVYLLWSDGRSWRKGPWPRKTAGGTFQIPAMRPGKNRVLAVRLDGGRATHFSKIVDFELTAGEPKTMDAALRPSLRIQGALSDNVPRPVRRGRIRAYTLPPAGTDDEPTVWETWTAIEPDGTFTIDGWPAGERMQLVALCDGYTAKPGPAPDVVENPPAPEKDSFGRPQIFDPGRNGRITVEMTPLVRCVVTAVDEKDKPLEGVTVVSWPNVGWWNVGSQIYCHPLVRGERLLREREYFDANDEAFPTPFQGTTDAQGKVTLELPAGGEYLAVESDAYEVPMLFGDRYVPVELVPGRTTETTLRLQPRGTEKLGEWDKLADVIFGGSSRESRRIRALPGVREKIDEFAKRFLEAKDQRDPRLLSEAYEAVADAFIGAGDIEEVFKRHRKAAEQAAKDKAGEQRQAKSR